MNSVGRIFDPAARVDLYLAHGIRKATTSAAKAFVFGKNYGAPEGAP